MELYVYADLLEGEIVRTVDDGRDTARTNNLEPEGPASLCRGPSLPRIQGSNSLKVKLVHRYHYAVKRYMALRGIHQRHSPLKAVKC